MRSGLSLQSARNPLCNALVSIVVASLFPVIARAEPTSSRLSTEPPEPPEPRLSPEPPKAMTWHDDWARVRPVEVGVSVALVGGILAFQLTDKYRAAHFQGGVLFDESARSAFRATSREGRARAQSVGTVLYVGSIGFSALDAIATAGVVGRSSDVLGQVLLMDLEAYAITGFLQFFGAEVIRRKRPYTEPCRAVGAETNPECAPNRTDSTKSFFAGHVAISFTNAGLTCAHHLYLAPYGVAGDASLCSLTVVSALTVAYTRMAADKHYASDVLTGMVIGSASGFLVPTLLHYRSHPASTSSPSSTSSTSSTGADVGVTFGVVPIVTPSSAGVGLSSIF